MLKLTLNFYIFISFYNIADFDIIEVLDIQTAFIPGVYLLHIIFKALQ